MLRENDCIKEFRNGNINIKFDADAIREAERDDVLTLSGILENFDCYFIGETYCLINYEMGHTIYNCYSDRVYIFPWRYLDDIKAGKMVKLYARIPDDADREIIEREG